MLLLFKAQTVPVVTRPITLSAVQWNKNMDARFGGNVDYSELIDGYTQDGFAVVFRENRDNMSHIGKDGDWIVVGANSERFFVNDEIFRVIYHIP